ncbi:MAG: glucoamylase family protein [Paracoccaceae bacterium]
MDSYSDTAEHSAAGRLDGPDDGLAVPIRFEFWRGGSLRDVGIDLAKPDARALPFFEKFRYSNRINENQRAILKNYLGIQRAVRDDAIVTPAAEWLLDNHHIVEESFRHLRRDLSTRVYRNLPQVKLADGTGIPRALLLMWHFVAVTNSEMTLGGLSDLIEGFQQQQVLTIGELWAIPALLRFVLLENLRRLSDRVEHARQRRMEANALADRLLASPTVDVAALLDPHSQHCSNETFALQLLYRLHDGSNASPAALNWIENNLRQRTSDPEHVVAAEHARQSSGNVTVGNIIRSLRTSDEIDWFKWFETVSGVDRALRQGDDYPQLDKTTRNAYREIIEQIARRSGKSEVAVAEAALARSGPESGAGEVLLGAGLRDFQRSMGSRRRPAEVLLSAYRRLGWLGIFLPALGFTLLFAALMLQVMPQGLASGGMVLFFLLALVPASEVAMGLVNLFGARLLAPQRLPAYDYLDAVPDSARTLVVIPCLLTGYDEVDYLLRALEVHYLSNPRGAVSFALLSDWRDSPTETAAGDAELLAYAKAGLDALAQRYDDDGIRRFYLLHRTRLFNAQDGLWMGWERKRGKLVELNQLLRGDADTSFMETGPRPPQDIRFVVTLDADTRLTRDAVPALVGKMAHPVNRPVVNPVTGRIVKGHGILQPRLTPSLTVGTEASLFQRIFSVNRGLDPYVFTASDLYQDLLGEGTYTGKGIYDVDAFEATTRGRIPDNTVLSHDLLEGSFARAALVSDVQMVEDFPIDYLVETSRQHRWVRGDWQLLPFILNPKSGLSALARLKMVDNLRRSLTAPVWMVASILGWFLLPWQQAVHWQTLLVLSTILTPIMSVNTGLKPSQPTTSQFWHLGNLAAEIGMHLSAMALRITFMAHQSALMADAILRTLYRVFISRRNLLQWHTARQVAAGPAAGVETYLKAMIASPAIAVVVVLAVAVINPQTLILAGAFAAIWIIAPLVAQTASRTLESSDALSIRPADVTALREVARITWRYFEEFVTVESNHLPPDNFQDHPAPKLAERTSPTNIGLYLLSVISARDFGWISMKDALDRIDRTLSTVERMETFRGHLFNWYDTRDLSVLPPHYVSSVDSGNLAGHLVAVSSALKTWARNPVIHQMTDPEGVRDTLRIVRRHLDAVPDERRVLRPLRQRLQERIEGFQRTHDIFLKEPQLAPVRAISLSVIADEIRKLARALNVESESEATHDLLWWVDALKANCEVLLTQPTDSALPLRTLRQRLDRLSERARSVAFSMDFAFLLNPENTLLSIGYRTETEQLDTSTYDLLASEARLASLFAIAKGDVSNRHWFRLGRPITTRGWSPMLLSWSGSMFEYLMPPLVMQERRGGILGQSNLAAVARQIEHGRQHGLPWGVSECAFNARDREMNYQYHAFGVPTLGLKRIAPDDRVVAPYASALASQFRPRDAVANLARLAALGAAGRFGFFDAVDFTPRRLPDGVSHVVVRTVMAHHQGMTIAAIANTVLDGIHRRRFHDDPVVQAAELLLQERAPREIVPITRSVEPQRASTADSDMNPVAQTMVDDPATSPRAVAVLSNGVFSAMLTATGAGSARLGNRAVTRWRPDPTRDTCGLFLFLRDVERQQWWSATAAPRAAPAEMTKAIFSDHKAEFLKTALGIDSHLEVIVASEANGEGHRLTLRNTTASERLIEVTSYGEIVLDSDAADLAHPAFSKMFVRTSIGRDGSLITARRNRRTAEDRILHLAHLICGRPDLQETQAETDRRAFIGRGRDLATAAVFDAGADLGGGDGFTLDPIFALRRRVRLAPGKTVRLTFWTVVAESAEALDSAVAHYCQPETFDHEARLAWTRSQVQLRHLDITLEEAALFRDYAAYLVYPDTRLAAQDDDIRNALGPQSDLWQFGISGDYPILLIRTDSEADLPILRKALRMQEFFQSRGVACDLVIVNERASSYVQDLQHAIDAMCENAARAGLGDAARTHVFALRRDQMQDDGWRKLMAAARIVLHTANGTLFDQLARLRPAQGSAERWPQPRRHLLPAPKEMEGIARRALDFPPEPLDFWNGYGGFAKGGREYVVRLRHGQHTPNPWINVIARPDFGFHISAEGAGYTWAANSRDYQITPWSNDPVINRPGEAFYIRDQQTGRIATPFASLSTDPGAIFEARHGLGQSQFRSWTDWIEIEAVQCLAQSGAAKLTRLRVTNTGQRAVTLDCAAYAELVLGNDAGRNAAMIRVKVDGDLRAVLAENPFSQDYAGRVTALACDRPPRGFCLTRRAFLGQGGSITRPAALTSVWPDADTRNPVNGDPCAALVTEMQLAPGESGEVVFILANAPAAEIVDLVRVTTAPTQTADAMSAVAAEWDDFLGALQVTTPDPKLDLMVNTWLPYQNLACRIRARSGFYQASGAYGFRDQLQDTSALILQDATLARRQILAAASRQFEEGDVQHWWLPGTGAGVRTMISDDVVWLAHLTAHYIKRSGDTAVLDEPVSFLHAAPLEPGQHDAFFLPEQSGTIASLYDHCVRALDLAIARTGAHGLPLILGGDWNDGMNRVGEAGKGESVWLGWFLCATLDAFVPIAKARGDADRAAQWQAHRDSLGAALEKAGWDGDWYRRGYYDDGTPLGSAQSEECRIDSIAQSWAVISGAARPKRAAKALEAALENLADRQAGILRLFTPPFESTPKEPGYIKGYPPGVRENGGQYTHAATWVVYALALSGRGDDAHAMFDMLNPISHALTPEDTDHYRVEPYVVAADVYGAEDKTGRGGWTWYTGSAGWLYRSAVEGLLGIALEGGTHLRITPALPRDWPGYSARLRHAGRNYDIAVSRNGDGWQITLNGAAASGADGRFLLD